MSIFYVSSYGAGEDKGIYIVSHDKKSNTLTLLEHIETKDFPSYMIIKDNTAYVAYKNADKDNTGGGVGTFSVKNNTLVLNTNYSSSGRSYTHLCVSDDDKYVFAANYHAGTSASYLLEDHCVVKKLSAVHHVGMGPDELKRQTSPHAHYAGFTPDKKFVYVVDLGADKVIIYRHQDGILSESKEHTLNILPGSGPRHMIFSKDGRFAYLVNELSNTVMTFKYVDERFTLLQVVNTVPHHFDGFSATAAIRLSASGKHLFVSNRGHDSIALYRINQETGKASLLYMVHTGKNPRDFNIIDDQFVIVASQDENRLEVLSFDEATEKLVHTDTYLSIPQPVCITVKE
jgi:6-phosphogluconolactonase